MFEGCTSLKHIDIPNTVLKIQKNAFKDCTSLEDLEIPDSVVETINDFLCNCPELKELKIGKSLKTLARSKCVNPSHAHYAAYHPIVSRQEASLDGVLLDCDKLERIIVDEDNPYFSLGNDGKTLYWLDQRKDSDLWHLVYCMKDVESIHVRKGIFVIDNSAFTDCSKLTDVYFDTVFDDAAIYDAQYDYIDGYDVSRFGEKVRSHYLDGITQYTDITLSEGESRKFNVDTDREMEWKSDNEAIATVSQDEQASQNGLITGVSAGKTVVTATAKDGSGASISLTITVNKEDSGNHTSVQPVTPGEQDASDIGKETEKQDTGNPDEGKKTEKQNSKTETGKQNAGKETEQQDSGKETGMSDEGDQTENQVTPTPPAQDISESTEREDNNRTNRTEGGHGSSTNPNSDSSRQSLNTAKTKAKTGTFTDVPAGTFYEKAVEWAVEKGITYGTGNGKFSPKAVCTRGQMVEFLYRMAGKPDVSGDIHFHDVPQDAYYRKALIWAVQNNITSGTSNSTFSPKSPCTRGQMAAFLYRMKGNPSVSGSNDFKDVSGSAYYGNAVTWLKQNGITAGKSATEYKPDDNCTRGEMVTFLYRYAGNR